MAGVPPAAFASAAGLSLGELARIANRTAASSDIDAVRLWEEAFKIVNRRLGEILAIRIELERRELRARQKRIAKRGRQ